MNKKYFWFLILPLLLVLVSVYLNDARGPYWLGTNSDPEYVYLLNSLNLAMMKGVGHIDHPGTPVQVWGAMVLRAVNLFSAKDIQAGVLTAPEFYLNAINTGMLALNGMLLLIIGLTAYRLSGSLAAGLWLQAAPFFFPVLLQFGLTRVSPEPMLFFVSSLAVLTVLIGLYMPGSLERKPYLYILLWALVCGLGVAVKITFAPLVVIPLFFFTGLKKRLYYLLATGAAFVIFTLPIIRMYPLFFRWIFNLLGHSGKYGGGKAGLPEAGEYFANAAALLSGNWLFTLTLFLSTSIISVILVKGKWLKAVKNKPWFRLTLGVAAAQVFGVVMVSKHASAHYLLPVFNLTGVLVLLLFNGLPGVGTLVSGKISKKHKKQWLTAFCLILGVSVVLANPVGGLFKRARDLDRLKVRSLALRAELEKDFKDYARIYFYRCSTPEYAFKYGSDVSRSYHAEALGKIHEGSNVYFYDIWTGKFAGFDYNRNISFETIRKQHNNKLLFMGSRQFKIKDGKHGITLREVSGTRSYEGIFIIAETENEEAPSI